MVMIQPLFVFGDWGLLVLRLVLGLILVVHGWPKIKDIKGTAAWMGQIFKPGVFWAAVVSLTEFGGGLLILLGLFTQIVAVLVAIQFVVVILKMKAAKGFKDGYEFDLLIVAAALALVVLGGGAFGLDSAWGLIIY